MNRNLPLQNYLTNKKSWKELFYSKNYGLEYSTKETFPLRKVFEIMSLYQDHAFVLVEPFLDLELIVEKGQEIEEGEVLARYDYRGMKGAICSSVSGKIVDIKPYTRRKMERVAEGHILFLQFYGKIKNWKKTTYEWRKASPKSLVELMLSLGLRTMSLQESLSFHRKMEMAWDSKLAETTPVERIIIPILDENYRHALSSSLVEHFRDQIREGIEILRYFYPEAKIVFMCSGFLKHHEILDFLTELEGDVYLYPKVFPLPQEKNIIEYIDQVDLSVYSNSLEYNTLFFDIPTLIYMQEALVYHKPLIHQWISVAGEMFPYDGICACRLGSFINHIIEDLAPSVQPEYYKQGNLFQAKPLQGDVPNILQPEDTTLDFLMASDLQTRKTTECTNCSLCVEKCPESLSPVELYLAHQKGDMKALGKLGIEKCTLCGVCNYICPSSIPLSEILQEGKTQYAEYKNKQE